MMPSAFEREIFTAQYNIFICDQNTPPLVEFFKHDFVTFDFLEHCYKNALTQIKESSLKGRVLLLMCHQDPDSTISVLPKELLIYISQIHRALDQCDMDFYQFNRSISELNNPALEEYTNIIRRKRNQQISLKATALINQIGAQYNEL
jgi:hypothetical protein